MLTCKFISAWWDVWLTTKTSQNRTGRFDVLPRNNLTTGQCQLALRRETFFKTRTCRPPNMPNLYLLINDKLSSSLFRHRVFRFLNVRFYLGLLDLLAFFYDFFHEMRVVLQNIGKGTLT